MLLLPGGGATSTVWFANVAALAARYRVHAVDLMGDAGRSRAEGTAPRTVDDLLGWLDSVVRGLGLGTFALAGHSYGAMIALAYVLRQPERVSALALLDPTSCFAGMRMPYLARAAPLLLRPTEKRQRRFVDWETGRRPLDGDWLDLLARGAAHFPATKLVVPKRPSSRQLRELEVRTTVILAGAGRAHDSERLAGILGEEHPGITVVTVGEATHHTLPMSPHDEVDAALLGALG
ncbi:alpha/beta hydrolase [Rhodococcus triatomae]